MLLEGLRSLAVRAMERDSLALPAIVKRQHLSDGDEAHYEGFPPIHDDRRDCNDGRPEDRFQPFLVSAPRQRTAVACQYCRRRKIRCSGFEGSPDGRCTNCVRFSQECVFTPVSSSVYGGRGASPTSSSTTTTNNSASQPLHSPLPRTLRSFSPPSRETHPPIPAHAPYYASSYYDEYPTRPPLDAARPKFRSGNSPRSPSSSKPLGATGAHASTSRPSSRWQADGRSDMDNSMLDRLGKTMR